MKNLLITILLVFCFAPFSLVFSQSGADQNKPVQWQKYTNAAGEFFVEMPAGSEYFYDQEGFQLSPQLGGNYNYREMRKLNGAAGKTIMSLEIYKPADPKGYLKRLMAFDSLPGKASEEKRPGFYIKQLELASIKNPKDRSEMPISFVIRYIASKNYLYVVTAANRGAKSIESERFLSSVQLNDGETAQTGTDKSVDISSLKPLTINDLAFRSSESSEWNKSAQGIPVPDAAAKNPTPLWLLSTPKPTYSDEARDKTVSGIIKTRITFSENGSVSKVIFESLLAGGLNRNVFFSAIRLKFVPREKDGVPEATARTVMYNFTIF